MRKTIQHAIGVKALSTALCATLLFSAPLQAQPKLAKLTTVETREGALDRVFFGHVKARETTDFAFQVGGQIDKLPIEEGQTIQKGDLIAELDLEPFELSLARSVAEREQAADDFDRLQGLLGTVSQVTVDDAETAYELAEIAEREAARSLRLATLRAPFDGIVARRSIPIFSMVSAGTPVVRLHDMSDLRIEIEIPELLFQRVGESPNVVLEAEFPSSSKRYPLEFREVTAETTQVGQSFTLTLGMAPPDDLFVLPGASATVYAQMLDEQSPIVIPSAAVVFDAEGNAGVMVFEPAGADSGTVTRQAIEVEPDRNGDVRVISGLEAGMEIIAAGASLFDDGDAVERFTGFSR
ncbi:MAG: efflux RND transporter periplasmic adaptor subunit [Pseudomonadota bacterium]